MTTPRVFAMKRHDQVEPICFGDEGLEEMIDTDDELSIIRYRLSMAMGTLYEIKNLSSTSDGAKRAKKIAAETVNAILDYKG